MKFGKLTIILIMIFCCIIFSACTPIGEKSYPTEQLEKVNSPIVTEHIVIATTEPTNTPIPEPSSTVTPQFWNNIPIALPDVTFHGEEMEFIIFESSESLQMVESYFLDEFTKNDWLVIENIYSPKTQFEGEVIFMRVLKENSMNCIMITSQEGKTRSAVNLSTINACSAVRELVEKIRIDYWLLPELVSWDNLSLPDFEISYPDSWIMDEKEMERQEFCMSFEFTCLAYFTSQTEGSIAVLSVYKYENINSQTLEEIIKEANNNLVNNWGYPVAMLSNEISLKDGRQAFYVVTKTEFGDFPVTTIEITTLSESEIFKVTGMLIGTSDKDNELFSMLNAMILSLSLNN